jgi:cyclic pyranopterin phosphate synthase
MPEEGVQYATKKSLLTLDEMQHLSTLFCSLGVNKIRITGGEPFARPGLIGFLEELGATEGLEEITLTTNGTLLNDHLGRLKAMGIKTINLSLDSLSRERFYQITRRDCFEQVMGTVFSLLGGGFEVKLNCVVAAGKNTEDIIPFVELTKEHPLTVRFLEEMPFNGGGEFEINNWNFKDILTHIEEHFPEVEKLHDEAASTSINFKVPGYKGSFGVIPSFSRTFCGTCNRIRLSATGEMRTCLYGPAVLNLRDMIRAGADDAAICSAIIGAVADRKKDGFEAEAANAAVHHSMSLLGG